MNVRLLKIIGAVALGFVLALAAGWAWGGSGRRALQARRDDSEGGVHVTDARARLLQARGDLSSLHCGAATGNLESAKIPLEALIQRYEHDGETARVAEVQGALRAAEDARRLAAKLDQSAQRATTGALAALERATRPAGK